ncbi:MAG: hypothetical protein HZB56_00535 [Deltaproteobacteria bacterium]|nr:hypothetical protein [Deltaproteobacteria bacterium]
MPRARAAPAAGRIALVLLGLHAAGCPSLHTMGPARTVPVGERQTYLAVGAYRTVLVSSSTAGDERTREWLPLLDAGVRFGLSERADLGMRLGLGGASIGPRFQVARSDTQDSGIDVLLEPSLGLTGALPSARGGVLTGVYLGLALPVGINLGGGSQLVLTPRAAAVADDLLGHYGLAGGSVALVLRIGGSDARPWFLVPECASAAVRGGVTSFGGPNVQCALGLLGPW